MDKKAIAAAAMLATVSGGAAMGQDSAGLIVAAQSDRMVWNGVVVVEGRIIVSGPRWAGGHAPALAIVEKGGVTAYPDTAWNEWKPGSDAAKGFVNVNAIHLDKDGALWVIDTGSPEFGGDPLPGGAKAVKINLKTNRIERVYSLGPVVLPGSYVDDIRVNGGHAYLTDAGKTSGIIVLDLKNGVGRRVLEDATAVKATPGRDIILDGKTIKAPDGKPLTVNADPLDLSADGKYFYFGPMSGPWVRIETRLLDDPSQSAVALRRALEPWADLPPIGGAIMDADGSLYFSELSTNSLKRRDPDGRITTIVSDSGLHWVDAPFIDTHHNIWLPVPQLDRAPPFNGGVSRMIQPITLYRYPLPPAN